MAYYNVCPNCGSHLNPGERCTCSEETERQQDYFSRNLKKLSSGQLSFVFYGGNVGTDLSGRREGH